MHKIFISLRNNNGRDLNQPISLADIYQFTSTPHLWIHHSWSNGTLPACVVIREQWTHAINPPRTSALCQLPIFKQELYIRDYPLTIIPSCFRLERKAILSLVISYWFVLSIVQNNQESTRANDVGIDRCWS